MKLRNIIIVTGLSFGFLALQGCVPALLAGGAAAATSSNSAASSLPLGEQVSDSVIKAKATNVLSKYPKLEYNSNVEITVFNRIILLVGQVPTAKLKTDIANDMSNIPGVRKIYNELQVGPSIGLGTYSTDAWITTKVKANMLGKVNPAHFKVVTEQGVVYLMGLTTKAEGQVAAGVASKTSGVKRVVDAFSYMKPQKPAEVINENAGVPVKNDSPATSVAPTTTNSTSQKQADAMF